MKANLLLRRTLISSAASLSSSSYATSAAGKRSKILKPPPPPTPKPQPPSTIQFSEDIRNTANFIGTVSGPVQRINGPSGGIGACTTLRVEDYSNHNSFKILLKMWDELAQICLDHVKQNDFLHVSGHVESKTKTAENEKSQTCCEVLVKEINYVAESEHNVNTENAGQSESGGNLCFSSSEDSPIDKNAGRSGSGGESYSEKQRARLRLWQEFFLNPSQWEDNRTTKVKPNHPDFRHKDSGKALWISNSDSPWVKMQLEQLDPKLAAPKHQPPTGESGSEKQRERLHLWQLLFTKPSEWHDYRTKKVNPKYPDFKHKNTGEALWINLRDPPWVKLQLQQLDSNLAAQDRKEDSTSSFSTFV